MMSVQSLREMGDHRGKLTETPLFRPRLIIHGGAGNIRREDMSPEKYCAYRAALLAILSNTNEYMKSPASHDEKTALGCRPKAPSAIDISTHALTQLEDHPLFNSGHGAVFTRDGVNELEASIMVSRGRKKRAIGVMGLRRVRNPIKLARELLDRGEADLESSVRGRGASLGLNVPSAQGHTTIHGEAAEQLAQTYGVELVDPEYFFTQERWDQHIAGLAREKEGSGLSTWDAEDFFPQGTCGAVALDDTGTICVATSTGGMTNKLTGRIGDTPAPGAGFWAEQWEEVGDPTGSYPFEGTKLAWQSSGPAITISNSLKSVLSDCIGIPPSITTFASPVARDLKTTRSMGTSGTGNGDSFLRISAAHTVAAMARYKPLSTSSAMTQVVGRNGELEKSAGDRWRRTGEGEGGMIGIEASVVRDFDGRVVDTRSEIVMDYNCGGMFRAWVDDEGRKVMSIWSNTGPDDVSSP